MQNRLDGYNDGYGNTFQGVRSQDSDTGQWSTPDAYAGDVHDPMSQKPYMYNHNNPLEYQDPAGFSGTLIQNGSNVSVIIFVHVNKDDGVSDDDVKAFISNVEGRLSGKVGDQNVSVNVIPVDHGGKGVVEVTLENASRAPGGDANANGGPGGVDSMRVGNAVASKYSQWKDALAGAQAHELWHTMMDSWKENGYHNPGSPELMNGGWPYGKLSTSDMKAAVDCSCNKVITVKGQ